MPTRPREKPPKLRAFIARTRHGWAGTRSSPALGALDPQRHFTPERHHLTPEQCHLANQLLRRAEQLRPLRGDSRQVQFRRACRIGGILTALRHGRVGNTQWGKSMLGKRGGRAMRNHALAHLRQWSPIASLAAMVARECRQAAEYYETHGEPLAMGAQPTRSPEEQRVSAMITQWEEAEWRAQHDRLAW